MSRLFRSALSLLTCSCMVCVSSASPSDIGIVMTTGTVTVDGSEVPGTSVIFSGSQIWSGNANSTLQFRDGTRAEMRPRTKLIAYGERSELLHGITTQTGLSKHPVIADGLTISSKAPDAEVQVGIIDDTHFVVEAKKGESEVTDPSDPSGSVVARIEPGTIMKFEMAQAAPSATDTSRRNRRIIAIIVTAAVWALLALDFAGVFTSSTPIPVTPATP
jgi:hypothetical protein